MALSDEDLAILAYAENRTPYATIQAETGLTPTRFNQRLVKMMTDEESVIEALKVAPGLMYRLRRLAHEHDQRRHARRDED